MQLSLPPRFTFAQFRQVAPIDATSVLSLIAERHAHTIAVKRAANTADNLRRIFDATFRLANKVGFNVMTLRDLSRESGLSMGGLYGYIATKDDLATMIEDVVRIVGAAIPIWFGGRPDPLERLDSVLRGHIFLSELLQPWFYFVFMESRTLSTIQKSVAKSSELDLQSHLAMLIASTGEASSREPELLAAHCQAMIQDWHVKRWKYKQFKVGIDAFADSVCRLALDRGINAEARH